MKITLKILSLFMVIFAVSCSTNDEQPNIENAVISFSTEKLVIAAPPAMITSDNHYARNAAEYVAMANSIGSNFAMFKAPAGATKSKTEITPANVTKTSTGGAVLVYTWTDPDHGSVAYQVKDAGTKYTFEVFFKPQSIEEWGRQLYAEEAKDRSTGKLFVYDYSNWEVCACSFSEEGIDDCFTIENDGSKVMMDWEWTRNGDNMNLVYNISDGPTIDSSINTKTKAGSVAYYHRPGVLFQKMTWDAQGRGTWEEHVFDGNYESGSW